ncbi:MAG TPA: archease [Candidatus Polarisedimenticolia bacterium]|nr:archease [Candidatus Polarisedimenticolia bacterium]
MRARVVAPVAYDLLDHTADLGVVVRGGDLADLFARAGAVLADLHYEPERVAGKETRELVLQGYEPESLLVRWLNELIVMRETEDFLWRRLEVDLSEGLLLHTRLAGESLDPGRHRPKTAMKAATYHELRVRPTPGGFEAQIIFDV